MNLLETLDTAKHSLFRFEYLQNFDLNSEQELLQVWREEHRVNETYMQEWWQNIAGKVARGVKMTRVSLLIEPASEYKQLEMAVFKSTVKYGEDIRIISQYEFERSGAPHQDFWIIDDRAIVKLNYTPEGKWLGFDNMGLSENEITQYLQWQAQLIAHSTPVLPD